MLCLNMIVKNEARILERCLRSVVPHLACYVIADTGSTDGTPDLIRRVMDELKVPGEIHDVPFESFGQARNAALDLCKASPLAFDTILLTDADMELVADDPAWGATVQGTHLIVQEAGSFAYDNLRVLDRAQPARYVGRTHEYVDLPGRSIHTVTRLPGVRFLDHCEGSNRADKFARDIGLLRQDLAEDPGAVRSLFYLAQSYKDMAGGLAAEAAAWEAKLAAVGPYAVPDPLADAAMTGWLITEPGTPEARHEAKWVSALATILGEKPDDPTALFYRGRAARRAAAEALRLALVFYERRVAAGGWPEEVWYSLYKQAEIHKDRGDVDACTAAALRAYDYRPTRGEPLHLLASFHRHRGENARAVLYARMGKDLPLSEDLLFVERYPTRWGFAEELAIAGFYSPVPAVRAEAEAACLALSRDRGAPAGTRDLARRNLVHYAKPLVERAGGTATRIAVRPPPEGWFTSTPSVAWIPHGTNGGARLACAVRSHNYRFADGAYRSTAPDGVVRSRTDLVILDPDTLSVVSQKPFLEAWPITRTAFPVQGFEDLRLFTDANGQVFASATARDLSADAHAEIVLLAIAEGNAAWEIRDARVLPRVRPDSYEKNWMPILPDIRKRKGAPRLLAHVDPPTWFDTDRDVFAVDKPTVVALDDARGGGQIVPLAGTRAAASTGIPAHVAFLAVVHRAQTAADQARSYTHNFLGLNTGLRAVAESPPFVFQRPGLEFAAGLAIHRDDLLISYHRDDCEAWIHRLPLAAALATLVPFAPHSPESP